MRGKLTIRFCGDENFSRRFLLQRQDGRYYTGRGWTACLDEARLYHNLATAQRAYRTIQNRNYRRRPKREFRLQLDLSVRGSGRFSADDLRRFLSVALHLNFDNAAAGDGPSGTYVQATAALWTLQEIYTEAECQSADAAD